jgi:hypothetical protein
VRRWLGVQAGKIEANTYWPGKGWGFRLAFTMPPPFLDLPDQCFQEVSLLFQIKRLQNGPKLEP